LFSLGHTPTCSHGAGGRVNSPLAWTGHDMPRAAATHCRRLRPTHSRQYPARISTRSP
jgi:hypothetical protein